MTPRSDTVARLFVDEDRTIEWIAVHLCCQRSDVEDALRRRFVVLKRGRK